MISIASYITRSTYVSPDTSPAPGPIKYSNRPDMA